MIKSRLAILVQAEEDYGTLKLKAHVMYVNYDEAQPVLSPQWAYGEYSHEQYAGLSAHAYLGGYHQNDTAPWGFGYSYQLYCVDKAAHAVAMGKVLTKLDKGMDKLNSEEGYVTDGNFSAYVLRFARVLGIKMFYVPTSQKYRQFNGHDSRYREVNGSGVQDFILTSVRLLEEGKRAELLNR